MNIFERKGGLGISLNYNSPIPSGFSLLDYSLRLFPCGEYEFSLHEDVGGCDVTVFQTFMVGNFSDDLICLQLVCNALKRGNVSKLTYFAPFLPYTRQDRASKAASSLGCEVLARMIDSCCIDKVITYDLHSSRAEEFFNGKVRNLSMVPSFISHIKGQFQLDRVVIVLPDSGAVARAGKLFLEEGFGVVTVSKSRVLGDMEVQISGSADGRIAVVVDDMIDSGETLAKVTNMLIIAGASGVFAYATHGIFSGDNLKRIACSRISGLVVSNSIFSINNFPLVAGSLPSKVSVLQVPSFSLVS